MGCLLIKNARILLNDGIIQGSILVRDSVIEDVNFSGKEENDWEAFDAKGNYVSAGFIDIHLHGGGGYDFMDTAKEAYKEISRAHLLKGSTTIIPTTVSSDFTSIERVIECYKECVDECPNFYGIHLEGPFLSKEQKGAHNEKFLHSPTREETARLLEISDGVISRITAAPELENMEEFATVMSKNGIHLSIGHSDATSSIALKAFEDGFSHITHMYCVTPSIRKINQVVTAGVVEAAYLNDNVTLELIADGKHVAKEAFRLAVKIKGIDKVCMVSDALRPAGTDAKESYLGEKLPENRVIIEDGVAMLPDKTRFAGSVATGEMMLQKGVFHFGFSVLDTVKMLTSSPAAIMNMKDRGRIQKGLLADFAVFNDELEIVNVIKSGKVIL